MWHIWDWSREENFELFSFFFLVFQRKNGLIWFQLVSCLVFLLLPALFSLLVHFTVGRRLNISLRRSILFSHLPFANPGATSMASKWAWPIRGELKTTRMALASLGLAKPDQAKSALVSLSLSIVYFQSCLFCHIVFCARESLQMKLQRARIGRKWRDFVFFLHF